MLPFKMLVPQRLYNLAAPVPDAGALMQIPTRYWMPLALFAGF